MEQGSTPAEFAYAFHINKNAIEAIPADACLQIDIMCTQLNQASFTNGTKNEWIWHYKDNWLNMSKISIISFHNSTGVVVNNATTAANSKILLPMILGPVADYCPVDVRCVCLQLELDFVTLAPEFVSSKILKLMYYLNLPQTSFDIANGASVVRSLVSHIPRHS